MSDFQRLAADVQSPYWWFTAVLLALLVNLLSSYLKEPLDRWFSKRSFARRTRLERIAAKQAAWAEAALADQRILTLESAYLSASNFKALSAAGAGCVWAVPMIILFASGSGPDWLLIPGMGIILIGYFLVFVHHHTEAELAASRLQGARLLLNARARGESAA